MIGTLYAIGYGGLSSEQFAELLPAGAHVVDVRMRVYSGIRAWSTGTRRTVAGLGCRYTHVPALGNAAYRTGGIAIVDIEAIETVLGMLRAGEDVVLLCACAEVATCHRRMLAEQAKHRVPALVVIHAGQRTRMPDR